MNRVFRYRPAAAMAVLAALTLSLGCSESALEFEQADERADERAGGGNSLKIATWNMQWLHRNTGSGEVPRNNADYQRLADYADLLDADVIAIQEVDGFQAAQRVFDTSVYNIHMSSRNSQQRTGFVYRKSLDVTPQPDYTALGIGNLRYGTDIEVNIGEESIRLLNVHLKSGCSSAPLSTNSNACLKLSQQVGPLEDWIDDRAAAGERFMVLGDFNRRLFANNNDDLWKKINDSNPVGASLKSPTQVGSAQCLNGKYPEFIDHLITGSLVSSAVNPGSFEQLTYSSADQGFTLSDHCPLSIELSVATTSPPSGASCQNACGGQSAAGCWCDDQCQTHGDCCADKPALCDSNPNSCIGSCGEQAPGGCWCNPQCLNFGDCCADYSAQC